MRHGLMVLFTQAQYIKKSEAMPSDLAPSAKHQLAGDIPSIKVRSKLSYALETLRSFSYGVTSESPFHQ
jgi:hypothetical protein